MKIVDNKKSKEKHFIERCFCFFRHRILKWSEKIFFLKTALAVKVNDLLEFFRYRIASRKNAQVLSNRLIPAKL